MGGKPKKGIKGRGKRKKKGGKRSSVRGKWSKKKNRQGKRKGNRGGRMVMILSFSVKLFITLVTQLRNIF